MVSSPFYLPSFLLAKEHLMAFRRPRLLSDWRRFPVVSILLSAFNFFVSLHQLLSIFRCCRGKLPPEAFFFDVSWESTIPLRSRSIPRLLGIRFFPRLFLF